MIVCSRKTCYSRRFDLLEQVTATSVLEILIRPWFGTTASDEIKRLGRVVQATGAHSSTDVRNLTQETAVSLRMGTITYLATK